MLRAAIRRTMPEGQDADIDDIEQQARIKVWKALSSGRDIRNPSSYLYRVAVNATLDALRQAKARREQPLTGDEDGPIMPEIEETALNLQRQVTPEQQLTLRQALDHAGDCLAGLIPNRRRAVGLSLQGFTTVEIGDLLGWSEAKARNLLYRGRQDLRRCLQRRGVEYEAE